MTTSCCSRLEEVNGTIILRHLLNIFMAELSSPFFQAAMAWIDNNNYVVPFFELIPAYLKEIQEYLARLARHILIFGVTKFSITKLENMLHVRSQYKLLPRVNFLSSAIDLCTCLYLGSNPF